MLRTRMEHVFASQESHELELVRLSLDTDGLDEREALENGWLFCDGRWYQCRSVRIDLDRFEPKYRLPAQCCVRHTSFWTWGLEAVYREYVEHKGFTASKAAFDLDRASYLIVEDRAEPIAFTKFMHYAGGLESQITAWNYRDPSLCIGKGIIADEVDFARSLGLSHLYIGQGCELGSRYKADIPGFEWWTGAEWSRDRTLYKEICARDSSVKTLQDLSRVFNWKHDDQAAVTQARCAPRHA